MSRPSQGDPAAPPTRDGKGGDRSTLRTHQQRTSYPSRYASNTFGATTYGSEGGRSPEHSHAQTRDQRDTQTPTTPGGVGGSGGGSRHAWPSPPRPARTAATSTHHGTRWPTLLRRSSVRGRAYALTGWGTPSGGVPTTPPPPPVRPEELVRWRVGRTRRSSRVVVVGLGPSSSVVCVVVVVWRSVVVSCWWLSGCGVGGRGGGSALGHLVHLH